MKIGFSDDFVDETQYSTFICSAGYTNITQAQSAAYCIEGGIVFHVED